MTNFLDDADLAELSTRFAGAAALRGNTRLVYPLRNDMADAYENLYEAFDDAVTSAINGDTGDVKITQAYALGMARMALMLSTALFAQNISPEQRTLLSDPDNVAVLDALFHNSGSLISPQLISAQTRQDLETTEATLTKLYEGGLLLTNTTNGLQYRLHSDITAAHDYCMLLRAAPTAPKP